MRRTPTLMILLAVFLAASAGSPTAVAARTRATAATHRASAPGQRAAGKRKPVHDVRSRRQRLIAHLTPVSLHRSHRPLLSEPAPEAVLGASGGFPPIPEPPAVDVNKPAAVEQAAPQPLPWSPLRGSHESLLRQNERTEADNLERILDDDDLDDRIARHSLVPVPVSAALEINQNLPANRRYCRPWTAGFLSDLARGHQERFHRPLTVSSAVRTVAYQKHLMRVNGNATSAEGDVASPHLTGASIDIAKSGLSREEIAWMRERLLGLQEAGKIDVEEEFRQACFHITVYKRYAPVRPAADEAADKPGNAAKPGI